jgi:hypothetical protein
MFLTRSEYRKLGLELVSLEDNRSRTPKKPSMAEEKKNDGADNIRWLRQGQDLHVTQQCRLSYGIQPFKDEVLCDVAPLDVCDVLLGQPYMWKSHAIYESQPCSVIFTLGGHLYRIPEVVLTTVPPKKCCKVVSHTAKFIFFTIRATTTASPQAPSILQKQVDKAVAKCKDSFCTTSSHVSRLVE